VGGGDLIAISRLSSMLTRMGRLDALQADDFLRGKVACGEMGSPKVFTNDRELAESDGDISSSGGPAGLSRETSTQKQSYGDTKNAAVARISRISPRHGL
jgi:hypothetical protein